MQKRNNSLSFQQVIKEKSYKWLKCNDSSPEDGVEMTIARGLCNYLIRSIKRELIIGIPIAFRVHRKNKVMSYVQFKIPNGGTIMNIQPLEDRILLKPMEAETKTAGGIIIPDAAKEKPQKGEVIATGPGKTSEKGQLIGVSLKKGDKILYGKYSGTEVSFDGQDYLIIRESDVLAVI
jgi:chaperonin GroES